MYRMTRDRPAERRDDALIGLQLTEHLELGLPRRPVGLCDAVGRRFCLEPQAIRVALLRGHPVFGSSRTKTGQPSAFARDSRPSNGADYLRRTPQGRPITHLAGFASIL
jgi:hypothetical protein